MILLVLDASAFIHNQFKNASLLQLVGDNQVELYSIPQVVNKELKDEHSRHIYSLLKSKIQIQIPTPESIKWVTIFATKTGDISTLSIPDLHIMALTLDLEKKMNHGSIEHLRKSPLPPRQACSKDIDPVLSCTDEWISPSESVNFCPGLDLNTPFKVGCLSSDFSLQNVLLQIGLCVFSSQTGLEITSLRHWILRCHACYAIEKIPTKKFCSKCGNATLIRTSIGINAKSGEMVLFLKKNFQFNNRGTIYSIPTKEPHILREDQKEYQRSLKSYHRELARSMNEDPSASLFLKSTHGKTSVLPPVIGYGRRNINATKSTH